MKANWLIVKLLLLAGALGAAGCSSPATPTFFGAGDLAATGDDGLGQTDAAGQDSAGDAAVSDASEADAAEGDAAQGDLAGDAGTDLDGPDSAPDSDPDSTQVDASQDGSPEVDAESLDIQAEDAATDAADAADSTPLDVGADAVDTSDTSAIADTVDTSDTGATSDIADTSDTSDTSDTGGGPIAPGGLSACDSDGDCSAATDGKKCKVSVHACVQCLSSKDCAAGDICQDNQCKASKVCKSDTDCKATNQVCDKTALACVDCAGDFDCSPGSKCQDSACVAVKPCKSSKDCPAVCDLQSGVCVQCVSSVDCGDGQACIVGTCKTKLCTGPMCAGGKAFACLDGAGYAEGKSCDDGNVCTEGDTCGNGACAAGPAKKCDDGNPCSADSCDPKLGCLATYVSIACDDGNPCTETDMCGGGVCAGKAKICDDGQLCTSDACVGGLCQYLFAAGSCTDGNACTSGDLCAKGNCQAGSLVGCDDLNQCTADSCDPAKGCVHTLKTGACDDGNNCTQNDLCSGGQCAGTGKQCNDGNPCTDDKCEGGVCSYVQNASPCDDGDPCTDKDGCIQGKCAGFKKICNDSNPCTDDTCMSTGCGFVQNTANCDDGNACSVSDKCSGGVCAGVAMDCNDNNPCTQESCQGGKCVVINNDGGPCGGSCDVCVAGVCKADPNPGMEKTYGTSGNDSFRVVLPAPNGGWLLAGQGPASSGNGYDDGWVVRVDAKGEVLWKKLFGSTYGDSINRGVVTPKGEYALAGTLYTSNNSYQMWLLVLDDSGAVKLDTSFGTANSEYGFDIALSAGGYAISGQQVVKGSSSTYYYGYVVQVDAAGAVGWSKVEAAVSQFNAVAAFGADLLVAGPGPHGSTGTDGLIQRLKSGGAVVWNSYVGGAATDTVHDVVVLANGTVAVAGKYGPSNAESFLLGVIGADGAAKWVKSYPVDASGEAFALAENGNQLVAVGRAYKNGYANAALIGVDKTNGSKIWQRYASSSAATGNDHLSAVIARPGGGLAAAGQFSVPTAGTDGWLLLLSADGKLACGCEDTCSDNNNCTTDVCQLGLCKISNTTSGTSCTAQNQTPGLCDGAGLCNSTCGNKVCDAGESNSNCPGDCPKINPCNQFCGGAATGYNCWCDATCKTNGDCCTTTVGTVGKACTGSTCAACQ
jgi:hypothetical protein